MYFHLYVGALVVEYNVKVTITLTIVYVVISC